MGGAEGAARRAVGGLALAAVAVIAFGWDADLLARRGLVRTAGAEEAILSSSPRRLARRRRAGSMPPHVPAEPRATSAAPTRAVGAAPSVTDPETTEPSAFERLTMPLLPDIARFARSLTRGAGRPDDLVRETYVQALRGGYAGERLWRAPFRMRT